MFFMVRVSKPSLFLQVCCLPPCFDDCHDGLFLVLCPSWPGSIMVTSWTLLVVPPRVVLSLWFLLEWSFPRGSSLGGPFLVVPPLVLSSWFLPGPLLVVPPWSFPCGSSLGGPFLVVPLLVLPCGSPWPLCSLSLSLSLSLPSSCLPLL